MSEDMDRVERIGRLVSDRGWTVVTAESLTSGTVAKTLGAGPQSAEWFAGGIVAYQEGVKFGVLGVREGPVVTAECAEQMARGAQELFGSEIAVSATGVGGPDPSEGKPPGTVFVAVATPDGTTVQELALEGDPDDVLTGTVEETLVLLEDLLDTQ